MQDIIDIRGKHHIPSFKIRMPIQLTSNYRAGIPPLKERPNGRRAVYTVYGIDLVDDYADNFYVYICRSNRFNQISAGLVWTNHYIDVNGADWSNRDPFKDLDYCTAHSATDHGDIDDVKSTVNAVIGKIQWLTEKDLSIVKQTLAEAMEEFLRSYYNI